MEIIAFAAGEVEGWSIDPAGAGAPADPGLAGAASREPTLDARAIGWFVRSPHTFGATWTGGAGADAIHLHAIETSPTFASDVTTPHGSGVITFTLPWRFDLPAGYGLLLTHPPGVVKPHAMALAGLLDPDVRTGVLTVNWKITTPNVRVAFACDEPVAMLMPVHLEALERFRPRMSTAPAPAAPASEGAGEARGRRRVHPFANQGPRWRQPRGPRRPTSSPVTSPPSAPAGDPLSPDRLFGSPDLYMPDFEPTSGRAVLARMSRQTYRDSVMLDQRMVTLGPPIYQANLAGLAGMKEAIAARRRPVSYVFHTAFCGSTLLARALDGDGRAVAYKEPWVLQRLSELRRLERLGRAPRCAVPWRDTFDLVITLLSRTWAESERAVVKPSDACNNLMADLLEAHEDSRAVLLYSTLEDFLLAVLKSPERREYVRRMGHMASADAPTLGITARNHVAMSDVQVAAYLWFVQQHMLGAALERHGQRVMALRGRRLTEAPGEVLGAAAAHLRVAMSDAEVASVIAGPVFGRHAKMGGAYDPEAIDREREGLRERHRAELEAGRTFAAELGESPLARLGE